MTVFFYLLFGMTLSSPVLLPLSNIVIRGEISDRIEDEPSDPIDEEQWRQETNIRQFFDSHWRDLKNGVRELVTFHPKQWVSAFRRNPKYPLFTLGDIDGFVALFVNNLATLLAVILGLKIVFESDIIYGKILPGRISSEYH